MVPTITSRRPPEASPTASARSAPEASPTASAGPAPEASPTASADSAPEVRRPAATRPTASADTLQIAGLTALSTCDWPGRLVATVFLQGCPWSCTYCHNPALIDPRAPGVVPWSQVVELLARRRGLLDGVVFSGGEPTRQAGLADAMRQVRDLGYGVGLHTGGAYPNRLAAVLPLVDWVGLDVKAPADRYAAITGVATSGEMALRSLRIALAADVALQVRTTVDPTVLAPDDVARLRDTLAGFGVVDHVLQEVRAQGTRPEYAAALAAVTAGPVALEPARAGEMSHRG